MNSKRKVRTIAGALLISLSMLTGCGASGEMYNGGADRASFDTTADSMAFSPQAAGGNYYEADVELSAVSEEVSHVEETGLPSDRKLIKTVNLEVETKEFDQVMSSLERQIAELGGYIENMNTYNGSRYSGYSSSRNASLTIRIPQNNLTGFVDQVSEICNVIRRSDNVDDVTLTYVDMASHRDALRTEQSRLLELLEKADSIEDILTIEERLTDVRYRLESMESQLRTMDNQVDYSTVYLNISEVKELTPVVEKTAWQRITEGFQESVEDITHNAAEVCIWFLVNFPHLVIWAAVIAAAVFALKKIRGKKAKKQGWKNAPKSPDKTGGSEERNE